MQTGLMLDAHLLLWLLLLPLLLLFFSFWFLASFLFLYVDLCVSACIFVLQCVELSLARFTFANRQHHPVGDFVVAIYCQPIRWWYFISNQIIWTKPRKRKMENVMTSRERESDGWMASKNWQKLAVKYEMNINGSYHLNEQKRDNAIRRTAKYTCVSLRRLILFYVILCWVFVSLDRFNWNSF